jgi:hypothetical protein
VTGNGLVDISYETSNGRTEQVSGATLPWKYEFSEAEDGDFLYVSAKIVSNEGSITVEITKDGDLVERATALGLNGIATASGTY